RGGACGGGTGVSIGGRTRAMRDVHGKVAVVTGAASGIGRGMCEAFIDAGMGVGLAHVEAKAPERTARQLRAGGPDVHAVRTDVSKPGQVQDLADESLRHYGAVHVVSSRRRTSSTRRPLVRGRLSRSGGAPLPRRRQGVSAG